MCALFNKLWAKELLNLLQRYFHFQRCLYSSHSYRKTLLNLKDRQLPIAWFLQLNFKHIIPVGPYDQQQQWQQSSMSFSCDLHSSRTASAVWFVILFFTEIKWVNKYPIDVTQFHFSIIIYCHFRNFFNIFLLHNITLIVIRFFFGCF